MIALVIVQEYLETLVSEMATHSNILAWEVPWTEDPAVYGVARVRHDLAAKNTNLETSLNILLLLLSRFSRV